jgi:hypothetical protein
MCQIYVKAGYARNVGIKKSPENDGHQAIIYGWRLNLYGEITITLITIHLKGFFIRFFNQTSYSSHPAEEN